jgi:hypothetical protein
MQVNPSYASKNRDVSNEPADMAKPRREGSRSDTKKDQKMLTLGT